MMVWRKAYVGRYNRQGDATMQHLSNVEIVPYDWSRDSQQPLMSGPTAAPGTKDTRGRPGDPAVCWRWRSVLIRHRATEYLSTLPLNWAKQTTHTTIN